ncbi:hypothetical protein MH117_08175 [Paenibacillus sp. ACRRX]|uniref:hypothetical protein n=1 Tax=Paenibacillus sp. ACRRX TaxID=2918206 RepID=UPI001EF49F99|nr:hypothetical protein [Paenibacillus sp. ACRRX]MCG7407395.1 hypothetical protein [Paenibacillus sp. ACRRX]
MNNDHKDPNNFENRLSTVEKQLNSQNKRWKLIKTLLFVIVALLLLLFSIGVVQFILGGS